MREEKSGDGGRRPGSGEHIEEGIGGGLDFFGTGV